jgi:Ran GTPase-activating protein 1
LTALLTLPKLHTVDLSDNAFGGRLAEPLKDFYSKAGPLRHLLLNNNGLGPAGGSIVANAITELAAVKAADPSLPPLETIVCGRNRLEDGSMDAWSAAYAAHKSLKTVKMVQNGIRPAGIKKLLRNGLSHCAGLLHLDLQDNTFTLEGAQALATVVPGWTQLEALCVGDCLLSARGGVLLGEALKRDKTPELKKLSLQYNEIDIKGVKAIQGALATGLPKLEVLELNGNKFSEEDPLVEELRMLFEERGVEGLDSLSDMEEESEEEDEGEESDEEEEEEKEEEREVEKKAERVLKEADNVEEQNVAQEKDKNVDALADLLGATKIDA